MIRLFAALALLAAGLAPAFAAPVTLTDLTGRTVTLDAPAERVVLVEGRQLVALSIVDPDFAEKVVGWAALNQFDAQIREAYLEKYPVLATIPDVTQESSVSLELVLAADPDLVIFSGGNGLTEEQAAVVEVLASAGVPSIYIDFRADPWTNTVPSLSLLAQAMGTTEHAQPYIDFYTRHRDAVTDTIEQANPERPSVFMFMQAVAGNELMAPGRANLGVFVEKAGGRNISADIVPGMFGALSPEFVLIEDPDIFIGTGGPWFGDRGISAGPGTSEEYLQAGLRTVMAFETVKDLTAVKEGRAYALWHNFHNSPLNVVALEVLAKWIHPELFETLDPQATVDEINARFLPVPFEDGSWGQYQPE